MPQNRNRSQNSGKSPNQQKYQNIINSNPSASDSGSKRNIHELEEGDYYRGTVKVLRRVKPGPLILSVFDGSGTIDAIGHDNLFKGLVSQKNGVKEYNFGNVQIKDKRNKKSGSGQKSDNPITKESDIRVDDIVEIRGSVGVHKNRLEITLDSVSRASMDFDALMKSKSQPQRDTFSIDSDRYEDMKPTFLNIAQRIRHAIFDQQPILIRHHHDADGICAGLAIEQAIRNVMGRRKIDPKNLIYRSPSVSPFYDQIDLFRDIGKYKRNMKKFGDKSPLILLLDTGSTPENLFPLQVTQSFNIECIVVDHHNPGELLDGKSVVCGYLAFHLNPYLFGWDSETCGGMLCYELARFIDEEFHQPLYPAVAALADRCDIPEVGLLIENCDKEKEDLVTMGRVIDYLSYHFKFDSGDAVYDEVFKNDQFVSLVGGKVEELYQSKLDSILPHLTGDEVNSVWLTELDLDIYSQRGKYPTPGKILGMVHDYLVDEKTPQPVLSLGYFSDGVIIRATHPVLPVPSLLVKLKEKLSEANVDGGGHEQAGSLKFLPAYCKKVKKFIRTEIQNASLDNLGLD